MFRHEQILNLKTFKARNVQIRTSVSSTVVNHVLRAYVTICNTVVTIHTICCNIYKSSNVPLERIYGFHVTQ